MTKASFVVLNGTSHKTGEPIVNRCEGCQHRNEQEEEHEEEPLMPTGFFPRKKAKEEEEEESGEPPLLPNFKY